MPNNGTLRLPLSPIGLHDVDEDGPDIETPPDPVDSSTYSSSVPDSQTLSMAPTMKLSTVLSGGVAVPSSTSSTATAATTTNSVAVELPPAPTESIGDEDDGDEEMDQTHSFWDWLTGKITGVWDKVTGHPAD